MSVQKLERPIDVLEIAPPLDVLIASPKIYAQCDVLRSTEQMRALLPKIAKLYADVFADPPWNECKVCDQKHYTSKIDRGLTKCAQCGGDLSPAYPEEEVVQKIVFAVENNGWLIVSEDSKGDPLAAAWGFVCSSRDLQNFYDSAGMKALVGRTIEPYMHEDKIFYISEVFVATVAQHKGFGTAITRTLVDRAVQLRLNIALRTHNESPMARIAGVKLAMEVVLPRGRDTDNEERILFAMRWNSC